MLGAALVSTLGCHAIVKEQYFLATPEADPETRNYYRVTVRGRAFASRSRYVSGFFDDKAVEEYFGEFSQPDGGTLPSAAKDADGAPEECKGHSAEREECKAVDDTAIDQRLENRSLVLLLSANSDAVAGQLGAMAENEHLMDVVGTMLSRGNQEQVTEREHELGELEARTDAFRSRAEALLATPEVVQQADVMALANQLASILGASERFADAKQARRWLDARRDALRGEGG